MDEKMDKYSAKHIKNRSVFALIEHYINKDS